MTVEKPGTGTESLKGWGSDTKHLEQALPLEIDLPVQLHPVKSSKPDRGVESSLDTPTGPTLGVTDCSIDLASNSSTGYPSSCPFIQQENRGIGESDDSDRELGTVEGGNRCANCEQYDYLIIGGLKKCGRCKAVAYCSKECQAEHWKSPSLSSQAHRMNCHLLHVAAVCKGPS